MLRRVAGATTDTHMLSVERVSGLGVIESLGGRSPVNHLEVFTVVIRMALDARHTRRVGAGIGGMKALVGLDLVGDFLMALKTLEREGLGGDFVAFDAIRTSCQALVGLGERSRGNLRDCRSGQRESEAQEQGQGVLAYSSSQIRASRGRSIDARRIAKWGLSHSTDP